MASTVKAEKELADLLKLIYRLSNGCVGLSICAFKDGKLAAYWDGQDVMYMTDQYIPYPKLYLNVPALRKKIQYFRLLNPLSDDFKWRVHWWTQPGYVPGRELDKYVKMTGAKLPGSVRA